MKSVSDLIEALGRWGDLIDLEDRIEAIDISHLIEDHATLLEAIDDVLRSQNWRPDHPARLRLLAAKEKCHFRDEKKIAKSEQNGKAT